MQGKLFVGTAAHGPLGLSELPNPAADVNAQERISASHLRRLLEQQRYRCAMTGRQLTPSTASIDHCVPIARGGRHSPDNLQIVHKDVNAAKNTMTPEEFVAMCVEVAKYHANQST